MQPTTSFPKSEIKILLLENVHPVAAEAFRAEGFAVETLKTALPEAELALRCRDVHVLGIRSKTQVTPKVFDEAKRLLAVGAFCIGTNQVANAHANLRGVPVFNAPFSNTRSVAELIIAEVVMLSRHLGDRSREVHAGVWKKVAVGSHEVRGKTLGIVGYGHIGSQVGVLAEAMGMRVVFYDILAKLPMGNNRACGKLEEVLEVSDFVTLHVPETPSTKNMMGPEEVARMKAGACLLNASRGTVVVIEALAEGIRSGRIGGAAVDVYPDEPESNSDGFETALRGLPNVILTPHIGGSTEEAQEAIGREVSGALLKLINAGATTGAVNFPQIELPIAKGTHRILNIHRNVPGVLRDINKIVSDHNANIRAQLLSTDPNIGYLIIDLDQDVSQDVKRGIAALETNIRTRILFDNGGLHWPYRVHISVFDIFKIGIGPSSSHTVGPMRAARRFVERLRDDGALERTASLKVELFGSLGFTGKGHGSDRAIVLGLEGDDPSTVDVESMAPRVAAITERKRMKLAGAHEVSFDPNVDLVFHRREKLPLHSNGMRFTALDASGTAITERIYYSVGGGFVVDSTGAPADGSTPADQVVVPYPFNSGADLLRLCTEHGLPISSLMLENEKTLASEDEVRARVAVIWKAMDACVKRGCEKEGILPGGLRVVRRAAALHRRMKSDPAGASDPLVIMDWVNLFALAVNEENAAGGRVVTAPTNGAAGIIPAVLMYYRRFLPNADEEGTLRFLLTAAAIGALYKKNASISGAEVGCQGEVGVACSMAAGALAEVMGGTPAQVENAAEIGMEHNLGLTCDPIGGLVQVPCIERNAMGAVKAINAARLALQGDGTHKVSLDKVIKTMWRTGADMSSKYKETARGGLAVNIIEC